MKAESGHQSSATTTIDNPSAAALTRSMKLGWHRRHGLCLQPQLPLSRHAGQELLPGLSVAEQSFRSSWTARGQLRQHSHKAKKAKFRHSGRQTTLLPHSVRDGANGTLIVSAFGRGHGSSLNGSVTRDD